MHDVIDGLPFIGVGVALVTLFDDAGRLDARGSAALAGALVDAGVRAVVVAGTTGEAARLEPDERDQLLAAVVAAVGTRVPVIAGTGAPTVHAAAELTARAVAGGAAAVLALSPPGASCDEIRRYYDGVATAAGPGGVPVVAYHFPRVAPPGIAVDALGALPVVAVKDSSGDPDRLLAQLTAVPEHALPVYVGSSALLTMAGVLGAAGAILALANVDPELCVRAFAGERDAQLTLARHHLHVRAEGIPGLKALVASRFATSIVARN